MAAATSTIILGTMAAASLGQGAMQADAQRRQGKFQEAMSRINERRANLEAEDAIARGEKEASNYIKKVNQVVGSQRSAFAAQGVDVNVGTAVDVQEQTRTIGAEDVQTIRNNAFREAMGLKSQAQDTALSGRMARSASEFNANQSLVAGGMQAASLSAQAYNNEMSIRGKKGS